VTGAASARRELVTVCHRLYDRGLIAGQDGNVSLRIGADRVLVTPAGLSKIDVTDDDLVEVSLAGARLAGGGERSATSELAVHLRLYRCRADVGAVVHAHPPTATAFTVAGERLMAGALPEIMFHMGEVAVVPYATPGTEALADELEPFAATHDAFLLANHGAVTVGAALRTAHQRMESLEHAARILLRARLLGRVTPLTDDQLRELRAARAAARGRDVQQPPPWARHME
jgi:L-fuculose-phosphate aldolase